jgi:predicted HicB family RNase H-like nuclease
VEKTETKMLNVRLHEELVERLRAHCRERQITVKEFVTDAIIEKLRLAHKERRKKPRM